MAVGGFNWNASGLSKCGENHTLKKYWTDTGLSLRHRSVGLPVIPETSYPPPSSPQNLDYIQYLVPFGLRVLDTRCCSGRPQPPDPRAADRTYPTLF